MKDIRYIIADNIKMYRKKENLTQFELAERSELSLDSIKRVESGKHTLSLENFIRIVNALKIPLSYLLYEDNKEIPDVERIRCILAGSNKKQKEYLIHMLEQMKEGLDKLS